MLMLMLISCMYLSCLLEIAFWLWSSQHWELYKTRKESLAWCTCAFLVFWALYQLVGKIKFLLLPWNSLGEVFFSDAGKFWTCASFLMTRMARLGIRMWVCRISHSAISAKVDLFALESQQKTHSSPSDKLNKWKLALFCRWCKRATVYCLVNPFSPAMKVDAFSYILCKDLIVCLKMASLVALDAQQCLNLAVCLETSLWGKWRPQFTVLSGHKIDVVVGGSVLGINATWSQWQNCMRIFLKVSSWWLRFCAGIHNDLWPVGWSVQWVNLHCTECWRATSLTFMWQCPHNKLNHSMRLLFRNSPKLTDLMLWKVIYSPWIFAAMLNVL